MRPLVNDLRYGLRALLRAPGFAVVAILTLALGIGATTTIFTVVNSVLFRPLPYTGAQRLANIWVDLGQGAQSLPAVSPSDFRDYQRRSRTFEEFAAATGPGVVNLQGNLTGGGEPERVDLSAVGANFFPLLGVTPALGRAFTSEEEAPNGPHVVLLSHGLWQRRYGGDPALVGGTIQIDGIGYTVVGILPASFRLLLPAEAFMLRDADLWVPLQYDYGTAPPRNWTFFTVFGRLRPEATFEQAQTEMDGIAAQLRAEYPEHAASNMRIRVVPLKQDIVKHARPTLLTLLGAVGLVLLIACANVAHLLLTRATAREGEFALRAALGASRWRMIRQLLAESALLAAGGGILGLGITMLSLELLRVLAPANLPRLGEIAIDLRVLGFTAVVCATTALVFGLAPAVRASSSDPQASLQAGGRSGGRPGRQRARSLLIIGEVALSVVLLVGAGLLVRSFVALQGVRPGFDAANVLTFQLSMPNSRYATGESRLAFYRQLEERLRVLPGVQGAGLISQLPLTGSGPLSAFAYNEETARNFESVTADGRWVSPRYFEAMHTRLLAGRWFTEQDVVGSPLVIIVDQSLASLAWPNQSPIGKQLQLRPTGTPNAFAEVVGVVEHMRIHDVARPGLSQIFYPIGQGLPRTIAFVVDASIAPASLAPSVRREVQALDKDLAVTRLLPMATYVSAGMAQARFSLILMGVLGGIALLLAAVGIFGVISYSVTQRTREFGIRLALGEDPARTRRSVVMGGMRLVAVSIVIGLVGSLALSRFIAGLLYAVRPVDPLTFAGIAGLLSAVALLACYLPARRATSVDPMTALRSE